MSVILGYQTEDTIIIAGDRRACKADGSIHSEESQKVFKVNKHLCFASAGRAVIEKVINDKIAKLDADNLYIEDIDKMVSDFYENAKEKDIPSIYMLPSYLIIGGLNKKMKPEYMLLYIIGGRKVKSMYQ